MQFYTSLGIPSTLFLSGFLTKTPYVFLKSAVPPTCCHYLIFLDLSNLITGYNVKEEISSKIQNTYSPELVLNN